MKYKNLKVTRYMTMLALTTTLSLGMLVGCGEKEEVEVTILEMQPKHFEIGEHIISIPIKEDVRDKNCQYEYHEGYEPVGISLTAYGRAAGYFGSGSIIYANVTEVDCLYSQADKDGNPVYLDFGTPTYENETENIVEGNIKEFGVGEHIISIPLKEDNEENNIQYEYHEGYEIVGIASTACGRSTRHFSGGVLLYKNIVPVKCINTDDGYTNFGIPTEMEKTKTYE